MDQQNTPSHVTHPCIFHKQIVGTLPIPIKKKSFTELQPIKSNTCNKWRKEYNRTIFGSMRRKNILYWCRQNDDAVSSICKMEMNTNPGEGTLSSYSHAKQWKKEKFQYVYGGLSFEAVVLGLLFWVNKFVNFLLEIDTGEGTLYSGVVIALLWNI